MSMLSSVIENVFNMVTWNGPYVVCKTGVGISAMFVVVVISLICNVKL